MEAQKKKKVFRIGVFVALTIVVILAVVLTMYFVQKAEDKTKIEYKIGDVGTTIENGAYNFKVKDLKPDPIDDDHVKLQIYIEIEPNEDLNLNLADFKLSDYTLESQSGFNSSIKSGEKIEFQLNYVVKLDQELLYLIYNNIKIRLGEAHA